MKEAKGALKITKACIYTRGVHVMLFKSLLPSSIYFMFPYFYNSSLEKREKKFFIIPQPIYTFLQYYYQVSLPISLLSRFFCSIFTYVQMSAAIFIQNHLHFALFLFFFSFCVIVNFIFMKMTIYVMCKLFHANMLVLTM